MSGAASTTHATGLRDPATTRFRSNARTAASFAWKALVGAILCRSLALSVLVVGWAQAAMARATLHYWWTRSPERRRGLSFADFLEASPELRSYRHWPSWVRGPREGTWVRAWAGALADNARLGIQTSFNTWVLTLPGCALWWLGWFAGWNNSFHKGYELAYVGPAAVWLGIGAFILAMLHVPLAQARQAVSGERRRFFDLRLVRRLRRSNPLGAFSLAALYAALGLVLNVLLAAPMFFPQISPELESLTPVEARAFLLRYYAWVSGFLFFAYVAVRVVAARIYASTVLHAVSRGHVSTEELSARERGVLAELSLLESGAPIPGHPLTKALSWMGARAAATVVAGASVAMWFAFTAQIFVREFLHHQPTVGWLNQALVHLPFVAWLPPGLGG